MSENTPKGSTDTTVSTVDRLVAAANEHLLIVIAYRRVTAAAEDHRYVIAARDLKRPGDAHVFGDDVETADLVTAVADSEAGTIVDVRATGHAGPRHVAPELVDEVIADRVKLERTVPVDEERVADCHICGDPIDYCSGHSVEEHEANPHPDDVVEASA